MGRSSHPSVIEHNSHLHPLQLSPQQLSLSAAICAACGNPTTAGAPTYTCKPCNYTLHASCTSFPYLLFHPSHPSHELHLLFSPAYLEGSFECDACGLPGNSFSYNCHHCSIDIHPHCALLPSSFIHPSHFHPLSLSFYSPYDDDSYLCDVCGSHGGRQGWLYRCSRGCDFDAHLRCIVAAAPSSDVRLQQVIPNSLPSTWHHATLPETFTGGGYVGQPGELCGYRNNYNEGHQSKVATNSQLFNRRVMGRCTGNSSNGDGSKGEAKCERPTTGEEISEADTFSSSSTPESTTGDKISSSSPEGNDCELEVYPATELKAPLAISRRRWRGFRG